jgi:hypothetical protein
MNPCFPSLLTAFRRRLTLLALASICMGPAITAPAFDWTDGTWGVVVTTNGTPGSVSCAMNFPGGTKSGNALEVYHAASPTDWPQRWVFLTDGFWRQTSPQAPFLTSYRLFRYYSSANTDEDRLIGLNFRVLGTNAEGELEIETAYSNNSAAAGDLFSITARVTLENPTALQSAMRADLVVSNATGRAVSPWWQGHRELAEQWVLFGISSMYVADDFSGGIPAWYTTLDPAHERVGTIDDANPLNDGYSLNGDLEVSTHDAKRIVAGSAVVSLDHDTAACPIVVVPGLEWYTQLVMRGVTADELRVQHAYRSERNHRVEVLACSGLVSDPGELAWAATYNREDPNLVDGDNIQIKLGMDTVLDAWPTGGVQTLRLRLTTGNTPPRIHALLQPAPDQLSLDWETEPGERYHVDHAPTPAGPWTSLETNATPPVLFTLGAGMGFFKVQEIHP